LINKLIKNIPIICGLIILLFNSTFVCGQDPQFTQFYSNPVYLNPAFAGSNICPRLVMNYRNQWPSFSGNFITTAMSYDQKSDILSGGIGFSLMSDNVAQTLTTNNASLVYSYHQNVTRKFSLNFGLKGTFIQKSVDVSKLTFGDMIDPRRGFVYTTNDIILSEPLNILDFSAGVLGFSENFFLGVSVHHLTEPEEALVFNPNSTSNSFLPRRYSAHFGVEIPLKAQTQTMFADKKETLSPSILYNKQGDFQELNVGIYYRNGNLVGGLWYRNRDSFILTFGIETDYLRIGYSYDLTTSTLSIISGGSHEVSLAFRFYCKPKKKTYRTFSCPAF
tara:strand:+ start:5875 stop:6876 length:1002 start_codon:yes stop_codon:yes gene_type:complete